MSGPVLAYLRDVGTTDDPCWVPCAKDDPGCVEFCEHAAVAELVALAKKVIDKAAMEPRITDTSETWIAVADMRASLSKFQEGA